MELDNIRSKELTFKETFIYMKEVLFLNFLNFLKIFIFWILFAFLFSFCVSIISDELVVLIVLSIIFAYVIFYLLYLTFISQARTTIDKEKQSVISCFKQIFDGFLGRKGLDLLQLVPAIFVISLVVFFPSSVFAIPLAFLVILAMLIFACYTILMQPILVIKKSKITRSTFSYSVSLINGHLTFVIGLVLTLAIACLVLYIPFVFIDLSYFWHYALFLVALGVEVLLFAIMLTVVYTNLEVAWSVGFKKYNTENIVAYNPENNHEFTEFFNSVPEIQIKEENKEDNK